MVSLGDRADSIGRKALTIARAAQVARVVRRVLEDAGVSDADLHRITGYSLTRIGAWWSRVAFVPAWLLAHDGLADATVARLVGEILALRERVESVPSRETGLSLLIVACGEALATAGRALVDGTVDDDEVRLLRPVLHRLHARTGKWLAAHGGTEEEKPS